jgi:hypothetical protein
MRLGNFVLALIAARFAAAAIALLAFVFILYKMKKIIF